MLEYKGYTGKIDLTNDSNTFQGEVIDLKHVIKFEGKTVDELKQSFRDSIDNYLKLCQEKGEQPEIPGAELARELEEGHKADYEYHKREAKLWENVERDLDKYS